MAEQKITIDISPDKVSQSTWNQLMGLLEQQVGQGNTYVNNSSGLGHTDTGNLAPIGNDIQSPNFVSERIGWRLYSNGEIEANNLKLYGGIIKSGKTSFTDSTNLGYYISSDGIYFGSAADATKLKFKVSDGSLAITGALTAGTGSSIAGAYITDLEVSKLTTGSITSKQITLALTEGAGDVYIASGKTDFTTTQSGFILGLDDSDSNRAKFYIGDSTHDFHWDGQLLKAGGWTIGSTTITSTGIVLDSSNQLIQVGSSTPITIDGANKHIHSDNYTSGAFGSGFYLDSNLLEVGNIACRGIFRTAVFQKDIINVIAGSFVVTPNGDVLDTDMTAADNSTLTIKGTVTLAVNDILRIKEVNGASVDDEWMRVTNIASAPTYTVTRDLAGNYAANTNPTWKKGAAVVDYGQSGAGGVYMTASDSNSPYLSIFTHAGSPWSALTTHLRLGNLNGFLGYSTDLYGIAIGTTDHYLKYDPTNGLLIKGDITIENPGDINGSDINNDSGWTDDSSLNTFISDVYTGDISGLQSQIDGQITTWFYAYEPTLINIPASDWTTDALKDAHLGDLFYDTATGYAYRFLVSGGVYSWQQLSDSDIAAALEAASNAQDTADGKRTVFTAEPTTPYYVGDLWLTSVADATGDLKKCITEKLTGAYDAAHWVLATDYTKGADWSSNLINIPGTLGTPSGTGLFLSATHLGFYDNPNWKTYMDDDGNFYLGGTSGKLQWDATADTLTIAGTVNDITISDTGYIKGGQTDYNTGTGFWLGYKTDAYKFSIGNTTEYLTWDGTHLAATGVTIIDAPITNLMTVGEALTVTTPIPIYIDNGTTTPNELTLINQNQGSSQAKCDLGWKYFVQTFTATNNVLSAVSFIGRRVGSSPTGNAVIDIYATDIDGKPTGSSLATSSQAVSSWSTSEVERKYTLGSPISLTIGNVYAIRFYYSVSDSSNYPYIVYDTTSRISGGQYGASTDYGSTWTMDANNDFQFIVYGYTAPILGSIYQCDDTNTGKLAYTGMLLETATAGQSKRIQFNGIVSGYSGLSIGSTYYLKKGAETATSTLQGTSTNDERDIGKTGGSGDYVGQTFTTGTVFNSIQSIKVKLKKTGSPSDNVVCNVYASDKTTLIGTADNVIAGGDITTSVVEYTFSFTNLKLSTSTVYFIKISRSGGLDGSNYYWVSYNTSSSYANGSMWYYSSGWTEISTYDLYFIVTLKEAYASGDIAPTAGTNSVKVGRAISDTQLLIYQLAI